MDVRPYLASLARTAAQPDAPCHSVAADLEELSHLVQKRLDLPRYEVPVLVGYSSGATIVYAALAQSPPGTFAGALSLGFCPDQDFGGARLCVGTGLHSAPGEHRELVLEPAKSLQEPWIALQGRQDQVCPASRVDEFAAGVRGGRVVQLPKVGHGFSVERNWMPQFRAAYASLLAPAPGPPPPAIADLPLVEVPTTGTGTDLAVLLTGDGGWAGLDREIAARLAAGGVPTVGLNSLKYFWTARRPEQVSADIARIVRHYLPLWHRSRVLLVGYSFGADVLPFVVNRLPPDVRAHVARLALMGIDANATFEISVGDWLGADSGSESTLAELQAIRGLPVLCIYGEGEQDSICPELTAGPELSRERIGTGHHFGGEYDRIAERILAFAAAPSPN